MTNQRKTYGLIGYPLSHSFSPNYFNRKFEQENIRADYRLFPLKNISEFPVLINKNPQIRGLNVTIPYKELVIPYLDSLSEEAQEIGAVNTIVFSQNGLVGHNTDAVGFEKTLLTTPLQQNIKALIFGTGGASKAVAFILKKHGINYQFISRRKSPTTLSYTQLTTKIASSHMLWINTTPVGMSPNISDCLNLPFSSLTPNHIVIDLIYNPEITLLLKEATQFGAITQNGLPMLHFQAENAWKLWNA